MSRSLPLWWVVVLLPAMLRSVVDWLDGRVRPVEWLVTALPGLVVLVGRWLLHRSTSPRALVWKKEVHLLNFLPISMGVLPGFQALGYSSEQLGALTFSLSVSLRLAASSIGVGVTMVSGFITLFGTFGGELEHGTLATWLLSPTRRTTLLRQKLVVMLAAAGALAAQALVLPHANVAWPWLVLLPLFAVATMPPAVLWWRDAAAQLVVPLFLLGLVGLAHLVNESLGWAVLGLSIVAGFAAMPHAIRHLDPTAPSSLLTPTRRSLRVPQVSLLVQKELLLQRYPVTLGLSMVALWGLWAILQWAKVPLVGVEDLPWGPLLPLTLLTAFLAGVSAFSEEATLGTSTWQLSTLSRTRLFTTKAAVSGLMAAVCGGAVPLALLGLTPGYRWGVAALVLWLVSLPAVWAVGFLVGLLRHRIVSGLVLVGVMVAGAAQLAWLHRLPLGFPLAVALLAMVAAWRVLHSERLRG